MKVTDISINWQKIKKVGEIILLGDKSTATPSDASTTTVD